MGGIAGPSGRGAAKLFVETMDITIGSYSILLCMERWSLMAQLCVVVVVAIDVDVGDDHK